MTSFPAQPGSLAYSPGQDAARGLEYSTRVLETDGFPDFLAASEAPQLVQAAGGQLIPHAQLQAQIDDAARVVAADPASAPLVERVRNSTNALAQPPSEPISSRFLNIVSMVAGLVGVALGILPAFGFFVSPWLIVGVLGIGIAAMIAPLFNQWAMTRARERAVAEHEAGILALLQRAAEVRAVQAQQAAIASQAAHVTLDAPTLPRQ